VRTLYQSKLDRSYMIVDHNSGAWGFCSRYEEPTDAAILAQRLVGEESASQERLTTQMEWNLVRDHIGVDPLLQVSEGL